MALTEFIVNVYLIYSISVGRIADVGLYIAMILAFYRLDSNLHEFTGLLSGAHELSINARKIREFFALESHIEGRQSSEAEEAESGAYEVELRDASFAYDHSAFSLNHIDLTIAAGEKLAIVGENGAGKSTLVKLMLRLYDLSAGEILINGTSIRDYDVYSLRRRIGVAFQQPNVYAMTYAENLSLYGEFADDEISDINRKLGLERVFSKNDAGYDAELTREFDEKGIMLSAGETQKIAIARIMRGDFGLLILDEPSSALDPLSEYQMTKLLLSEANKTTTVMIAHRLSTIRDADKIALIDEGRVKEYGNHDELMSLRGTYYEMFTKQAENYVK